MKKIFLGVMTLLVIANLAAQDKTVQELKDEASKTIKKDPNDTIPQSMEKRRSYKSHF